MNTQQPVGDSANGKNSTAVAGGASKGWIVATWLLAAALVVAGVFSFVRINDLQTQVDDLAAVNEAQSSELAQTTEAGQAVVGLAADRIATLEDQVAALKVAGQEFAKQSEQTLQAAAEQYAALEQQLATTEQALKDLVELVGDPQADAKAVTDAFDQLQADLVATQTALAEVLEAVAESANTE